VSVHEEGMRPVFEQMVAIDCGHASRNSVVDPSGFGVQETGYQRGKSRSGAEFQRLVDIGYGTALAVPARTSALVFVRAVTLVHLHEYPG